METAKLLGQSVRKKILQRLKINIGHVPVHKEGGDHEVVHVEKMTDEQISTCEGELRRLFACIDTDGSMLLSRAEFKDFLGDLHISFSAKRWRQIFR